MRRLLIPVLLLSLATGCSDFRFGPHRINVQQGNALDQENVSRLKLGLNRTQVRFLLGTPLLVDPFHTDRWDYVYVYYKAGNLAEQKRISLFFDGETLVRIEGDMPVAEQASSADNPAPMAGTPQTETPAASVMAETGKEPVSEAVPAVAKAASEPPAATAAEAVKAPPVAVAATAPADAKPAPSTASPTAAKAPLPMAPLAAPAKTQASATPTAAPDKAAATPVDASEPATAAKKPAASPKRPAVSSTTSIVQPMPSPKDAPPYKDPRPVAELGLQAETDVAQIKPDVMPTFPGPAPVEAVNEAAVMQALNAWVSAWERRDDEAYFAAYVPEFVPQGGGSHADWVKRRRMLLDVARNIEIKIESPSVDRAEDGSVTITFNQFYRSESYRDAVVKQLRMVDRDGRWLIVDEKVLSVLHGAKP